jgi:hypothetical protein
LQGTGPVVSEERHSRASGIHLELVGNPEDPLLATYMGHVSIASTEYYLKP